MTALGCSDDVDVFLLPRDGGNPIRGIPWTSVDWERTADAPSGATVEAKGVNGDVGDACCEAMIGVEPWAYELGVYRNAQRCWAGPITSVDYGPDGVTIHATDISAWLGRRWIHKDHVWTEAALGVIVAAIVEDAMAIDPFPGLVIVNRGAGVTGTRTVKAKEYRVALTEIDDIVRSGLDWSVVDRTMTLGDFLLAPPVATIFLADTHFSSTPAVSVDGNMGTRWAVLGGGGGVDGPGIIGTTRFNPETVYGVHERTVTDAQILTQKQANQAAEQYRGLLGRPSAVVAGGTLDPSAPVSVDQLIPGALLNLGLSESCRTVGGVYRLRKVTGKHDATSDSIAIECEPAGDVDLSIIS